MLYVAQHQQDAPVRAGEIAGEVGLPPNYLSKILHALARAGVLVSERGPRGGFKLARPAEEISLSDVIEPFDPLDQRQGCVLGRGECSEKSPCRLHDGWKNASDPMIDFFSETALADLLDKADQCK
jgi:Rrf2 family protein